MNEKELIEGIFYFYKIIFKILILKQKCNDKLFYINFIFL